MDFLITDMFCEPYFRELCKKLLLIDQPTLNPHMLNNSWSGKCPLETNFLPGKDLIFM